jgi:hypothetical protein
MSSLLKMTNFDDASVGPLVQYAVGANTTKDDGNENGILFHPFNADQMTRLPEMKHSHVFVL